MNDRDRRKFERVNLPATARVYAHDEQGNRVGRVLMLGRGGMLVEPGAQVASGARLRYQLVDDSEGICRPLQVVVRYVVSEGIGYEFENLDPDAAVEIGVIIGKYYAATQNH